MVDPAGICPGGGVGPVGRRLALGLFGSHWGSTGLMVVVVKGAPFVGGTVNTSVARLVAPLSGDAQPVSSAAVARNVVTTPSRSERVIGSVPVRRGRRRHEKVGG